MSSDELPHERFEYPHPLAPYNADQELALLRERIASVHAGEPGVSIEEAMAAVDRVLTSDSHR